LIVVVVTNIQEGTSSYKWLAIPPKRQPPNHYLLLGLQDFESDKNVIESAANRQMPHVRTFQSGRHATHTQFLLNEISAARICLLVTVHGQGRERLPNSQSP